MSRVVPYSRYLVFWYLHSIDLHHVANYYYAVEMHHVVRGIDCGSNGDKLPWRVWKGILI